ncbi:hypothetical protein STENM36S_03424 [Streptomyces tendae]
MPSPRSVSLRRAVGVTPARRLRLPRRQVRARSQRARSCPAHGIDKLADGPAAFGAFLGDLNVPAPTATGWAVAIGETLGGLLLVVGLLSRLTALLLTAHLCVATALVDADTGFMTPQQGSAGGAGGGVPCDDGGRVPRRLLTGPGPLALDRVLGIETPPEVRQLPAAARPSAARASLVSGAIEGLSVRR